MAQAIHPSGGVDLNSLTEPWLKINLSSLGHSTFEATLISESLHYRVDEDRNLVWLYDLGVFPLSKLET
jgi:hypothetical protein